MENFECSICCKAFEDPVECLNCNNNFCKSHISGFKNKCPLCNNSPFNYRENIWLKRTISNIDFSYKCITCDFEGDQNAFWAHLIETHKNEIIAKFNANNNKENKEIKNIKSSKEVSGSLNLDEIFRQNANMQITSNTPNNVNNQNHIKYQYQTPYQNPEQNQNPIPNQNSIQNPYQNKSSQSQNCYPNFSQIQKNNSDNSDKENERLFTNTINPPSTQRNYPNMQTLGESSLSNFPNENKPKEFTNIPPPSSERNALLYCGNYNELIKCNCCPDHICRKGNCLCVKCMRRNIQKFRLQDDELINRSGKKAKLFKGSYYCGCEYDSIIKNVIGRQFKKHSQCKFPFVPCDDCKVLTKYQNLYH